MVRVGEALYCGQADVRGRPHGQGTLLLPDGSVHRGRFQEGRAHGPGELATAAGLAFRGCWEANRRVGRFELLDAAGKTWAETYDAQGKRLGGREAVAVEPHAAALPCARCSAKYHEGFNHEHSCRKHRGEWAEAVAGGVEGCWTCCGRGLGDRGCDLALHRAG